MASSSPNAMQVDMSLDDIIRSSRGKFSMRRGRGGRSRRGGGGGRAGRTGGSVRGRGQMRFNPAVGSGNRRNQRGQRQRQGGQRGQGSSAPQRGFGRRGRGRGRSLALSGRLGRPQGGSGSPQRRRNQNTSFTRPKPSNRSNIINRLGGRLGGGGGNNSVSNRRAKLSILRARRIATGRNRNASSSVNPISIRSKENAIINLIDRATRLQQQVERQRLARNKAIAMKRAFFGVGDEEAAAAAPPRRLNRNDYLGFQGASSAASSSSFNAGGGRRRRRGRGGQSSLMTVRVSNPGASQPRNQTAQFEAEARELIANVKQRARQQNSAAGVDLSFD